tara:strand:+ start:3200 stop:4126 length:927 start_codon:yes stop_codon:yes gene_type:complete
MASTLSKQTHGKGRECVITRRACFSSSHRYFLPEISPEENIALFGNCSLAPGHGHNYELIVSMGGKLDSDGMVLNLSDVKHAIKEKVTSQLDYHFLNDVWPEFDLTQKRGTLPTTEALIRAIWERLKDDLPLTALKLYESPNLWAEYQGNTMETLLTVQTHFAAAHRLAKEEISLEENKKIYGKCARVNGHGHNYLLEVTVRGTIDKRTGMICDLSSLQNIIEELVVEQLDHTFLNKDIEFFHSCVPTAENIALFIADILNQPIKKIGANLHKIRLQESPNNAAEIHLEKNIINSQQVNLENSLVTKV